LSPCWDLLVGAGIALPSSSRACPRGLGALRCLAGAEEYQRERILVFLDPFRDPLGARTQMIQAKIGLDRASSWARAWPGATAEPAGISPERSHGFHPLPYSRMWGFVGCLVLLLCYVLSSWGLDIAATAREPVGRLVGWAPRRCSGAGL